MITIDGLNLIASSIKALMFKGRYKIGSTFFDTPIFNSNLNGNVLTIQLYLDDSVVGTISDFQLVSQDGTVVLDKPDSIVKTNTKGLLIIFNLTISEI